ncbi:MAG: hypothetical protein AB8B73_13495 [Ekhidna sp.]
MKKIVLSLAACFLVGFMLQAQTVEDFEVKTDFESQFKKVKTAPKKIYIHNFAVYYQLLYMDSDVAAGGREIGGGYRSDASASLLLGIAGIPQDELQKSVDNAYNEYVARLKAKGFEIITPDEALKTETLAGWSKAMGGTPSETFMPGYVSVTPTGYEFLYNEKGGGFNLESRISKDLEGAVVANVSIILPAFEDGESAASKAAGKSLGGIAKVVAKANFRIGEGLWIKNNSLKGGFPITSNVAFIYKKSLKYQAAANFKPKKEVEIEGVFDPKKKYKAVESASQDLWGSSNGAFTVFSVNDQTMKKTQAVECDPKKYVKGADMAVSMYVSKSLDKFLMHFK